MSKSNPDLFPMILCEQSHDLPLCKLQVTFTSGSSTDETLQHAGQAVFSGELMVRSINGMSYIQIKEALAQLGARLSVHTSADTTTFELLCLRHNLDRAKIWLKQALLLPSFAEEEATRIKREMIEELHMMQDDDASLAGRMFYKKLFSSHPYGIPSYGTELSIAGFNADIAKNWYKQHLSSKRVIFGAAGDISPEEIKQFAQEIIPNLPTEATHTLKDLVEPTPILHDSLFIVDKPERTQAQIYLGHLGPAFGSPVFLPLHIAMTAFGGTFTSRLMREIRSKRGLSYGVSAGLGPHKTCSAFVMHVYPFLEQAGQTLELMLALYEELRDKGLQEEEITFAKNFLSHSHPFDIQTPEQKLRYKTRLAVLGAPTVWADTMPTRIMNVTSSDIHDALSTFLKAHKMLIAMVGTKEQVLPQIESSAKLSTFNTDIQSYSSLED